MGQYLGGRIFSNARFERGELIFAGQVDENLTRLHFTLALATAKSKSYVCWSDEIKRHSQGE